MRILIADDQNLVREAIAGYLRSRWEGAEVLEASSLTDALQRLIDVAPFDVILLDLWMPGMDGLAGLTRIRAEAPNTPVILVSGDIDGRRAVEALSLGARGIITKDVKGVAFVGAIEVVMEGETFVPAFVTRYLMGGQTEVRKSRDELRRRLGGLSERELEILEIIAKGLDTQKVAEQFDISPGTVKLHLHRAFEKSGARNRADAVRLLFETRERVEGHHGGGWSSTRQRRRSDRRRAQRSSDTRRPHQRGAATIQARAERDMIEATQSPRQPAQNAPAIPFAVSGRRTSGVADKAA